MSSQPGRRAGSRLVVLLLVIAVVTTALDQLSKLWATSTLVQGEAVPILGEWLQFDLVHNSGAAFSLGTGMTWVLTLLACVIVVVILRVSTRLGSVGWAVALGLLLGGALGNLIDRMVRPPGPGRGRVVDFIDYGHLFVGNVADIAIVAAGVLVVWLCLRGVGLSGPARPADPLEGSPDADADRTSPVDPGADGTGPAVSDTAAAADGASASAVGGRDAGTPGRAEGPGPAAPGRGESTDG